MFMCSRRCPFWPTISLAMFVSAPASAQQPPLLKDYISFTVQPPPAELQLDPFYKKYVDAQGIPVVSSDKVPDAALLMVRDMVQFMLSERQIGRAHV